jgi:hypothetical protein
MSTWVLLQCYSVFNDFLATCEEDMRKQLMRKAFQLMELGNGARRPISAVLTGEDGLLELIGSTNIEARALFCFQPGRRIVFLEACIKKGAIPEPVMKRTRDRKQLVDLGMGTNVVRLTRQSRSS